MVISANDAHQIILLVEGNVSFGEPKSETKGGQCEGRQCSLRSIDLIAGADEKEPPIVSPKNLEKSVAWVRNPDFFHPPFDYGCPLNCLEDEFFY
jgi:hypothetical protein